MFSVDHILVAVDPLLDHDRATSRGADLAKRLDCRLEFFLCDYEPSLADTPFLSKATQRRGRESHLRQRRVWLESLAKPYRNAGLDVETDVVWGKSFHEEVTRKALRSSTDLVVKSTHYHSAVQKTFYTSSDWHLIRDCPAALYFAKLDGITPCNNAIAALDPVCVHQQPTFLNQDILRVAQELQACLSLELHLANWYHLPLEVHVKQEGLEDYRRWRGEKMAEICGADYEALAANTHYGIDRNEDFLIELVQELRSQIVFMGALSRGFLDRVAIGSTAERLLDQLSCDIVVVKPHDFVSPVKI